METKFNFTLTKPQIVEVFKKQARRVSKPLLIMAIVVLCFVVLVASLYFFVDDGSAAIDGAIFFAIVDLFAWLIVIIVRNSALKNAENYFKYHCANEVVEYCYELTDVDVVVSQPTIGNVAHYKYAMITRVIDLGGYVAVMLVTNQYFPIPTTEHTAPLISTLKSLAQVKK